MKQNAVWGQLALVAGILTAFCMTALFTTCNTNVRNAPYIAVSVMFAILCAVMLGLAVWNRLKQGKGKLALPIDKAFLLVAIVFIVIRLAQFDTLPRWDSETYFAALRKACENYEYDFPSLINNFFLAGHVSLGYALFLAMGYFIWPNAAQGVYAVNLLLSFAGFCCTWGILRHAVKRKTSLQLLLAAFLIWCMPLTLGTFSGISLDYGIMLFLVFLLYSHIKQQYLLMLFWALALATTKETGVICLAGYGVICVLQKFLHQHGSFRDRGLALLKEKAMWILLGSGGAFLLMRALQLLFGKSSWGTGISKSGLHNVFKWQWDYVLLKLQTFFLLNFYWVLALLILYCVLAAAFGKKQRLRYLLLKNEEICCAIGAAAAFIVFSCIYLTYNNPRYNVVVEYILALVCVIFVMWTITEQTVCNLVIGQLCVIMLVQSYYTVDPVTKAVFPKVNTESAFPMVTTGWSGYPSLQADITVYNNQYTYLDKAYDKILSNIGYDENTVLIMWGSYEKGTRAAAIQGIRDTYYWDKKQHKRMMEESKNTCEIKVLYQTDFKELLQQGNIPQRAVLICTPHVLDNEWEATSELWQYYSFDSRHVVSVGESGSVIYYRLYREE